jgi:hypothetical protein
MFGVPLIGPADILCEVKTERVEAQICGKIRDFDEASHSDVKMLTESLSGLPTNVHIHVSLVQAKESKDDHQLGQRPRQSHQETFDCRFGRGVVPHKRACLARRRMLRPMPGWHLL